jgi:hypothetical protein
VIAACHASPETKKKTPPRHPDHEIKIFPWGSGLHLQTDMAASAADPPKPEVFALVIHGCGFGVCCSICIRGCTSLHPLPPLSTLSTATGGVGCPSRGGRCWISSPLTFSVYVMHVYRRFDALRNFLAMLPVADSCGPNTENQWNASRRRRKTRSSPSTRV